MDATDSRAGAPASAGPAPRQRKPSKLLQAEAALQVSEQLYRTVVDNLAVGVVIHDANGRIVEGNRAAREILGLTADVGIGGLTFDPMSQAVWADGTPATGEHHPATIAQTTGRAVTDVVMGVRHASGTVRWLLVSASPLRDPAGDAVTGVVMSLVDLTDARRRAQSLRDDQTRLNQTQELTKVGGWAFEVASNRMTWTDEVYRIHEATRDYDPNGPARATEFYAPEDQVRIREAFHLAVDEGRPYDLELRLVTATGRGIWVRTVGVPQLEDGRVVRVFGDIQDITARRAAEDALRDLNAELEERVRVRTAALLAANTELEAFSYSVSHDLRAPLRAIDAFSQILLNEYAAPLDVEGRRVLGVVLRNVKMMGVLIDDLLAFSRVTRKDLERRPVDMNRLVAAAVDEIRAADPARDIAWDVGHLSAVKGDPALLRQVWTNLLGNAAKFSRSVAAPRIEVRSERVDGERQYTVRDNGVGFDLAYGDKLFKPFSRLHSTSEFEGTGIGLAIVARIVGRHGGRVWAEGTPDGGATFGFSLPAERKTP